MAPYKDSIMLGGTYLGTNSSIASVIIMALGTRLPVFIAQIVYNNFLSNKLVEEFEDSNFVF